MGWPDAHSAYNAWQYRKKLTVAGASVAGSGAITGVPLFFRPSEDSDIAANARPDGYDILFTNSSGTKLPHELLPDQPYARRNAAFSYYGGHNAVYHNGTSEKLYVGSIGTDSVQVVTEYNYATGAFTHTTINTAGDDDDHSAPVLLMRSADSKLLVFYEETHAGAMSYKLATNAESSTAWGSEVDIHPDANRRYSYPAPHELTNEGLIYLFYRYRDNTSGPVETWRYITTANTGTPSWSSPTALHPLNTGGWGTRPYFKFSDNGSRIDILASTSSPDLAEAEGYKVVHFYYDGDTSTFHKSDGTNIGSPPFDVDDLTLVYDGTSGTHQTWVTNEVVLGSDGRPRCLFYVYPSGVLTNKDLYYGICGADGTWTTEKVLDEGGSFTSTNTTYPSGGALDPNQDDVLITSVDSGQNYAGGDIHEVEEWTRGTGSWAKRTSITSGSPRPHIRAKYAKNCPIGKAGRVLFMSFDTYVTYNNFTAPCLTAFPAFGSNFARAYVLADIHGTNNTDLYVYWGNANATNQQNVAAVWAAYSRVYHTQERYGQPAGFFVDATGNSALVGHRSSSQGSDVDTADIGASWGFSSERITAGTINMASWTACGVEAWTNYDSSGTDEHSVFTADISGTTPQFTIRYEPNSVADTVEMFCTVDTNSSKGGTVSTIAVTPNTWEYVYGGWTPGGGIVGRMNKVEGTVASSTGTAFDASNSPTHYIGRRSNDTDQFKGNMAEIRISNNKFLSKDQTDTQYDNWTNGNSFYTVAALESVAALYTTPNIYIGIGV